MRVSARCSQRSLRSFRMVCAETSNRRARSSTTTRPEARAIVRISVWRWDNPATAAPLGKAGPMVRRFDDGVNEGESLNAQFAPHGECPPEGIRASGGDKDAPRCKSPPHRHHMLILPALAIGLLGVIPAFAASADEDAVAKERGRDSIQSKTRSHLERDGFSSNRHLALSFCLSMI